jgi:hypothetical protein
MQKQTSLQWLYLLLAIIGVAVPWYFVIVHLRTQPEPLTPGAVLRAGFSSPLAATITTDLLIGVVPFLIWLWREGKRLGIRHLWAYVVSTFIISFAFACGLFLFFRERKLQQAA